MTQAKTNWEAIAARLQEEGQIAVSKAARFVKAERGRRGYASASTLVRWIIKGKQGVRLEGVRGTGSTWYTSKQALARFQAKLSEVQAGESAVVAEAVGPSTSEMERRRQGAMEGIRRIRAAEKAARKSSEHHH